jgi:hypothetical protein
MRTGGINGGATGGANDGSGQNGGSANSSGANGSGAQGGGQNGGANGGDIAYGSSDDPFAGLGKPGSGGMSTAERRAALDARLEESYGTFDGIIIAEREKAQNEANAAGSEVMGNGDKDGEGTGAGADGTGGEGAGGGLGGGGNLPGLGSVIVANGGGSNSGGGYMPGPATRQGEYSNASGPTFTPPPDIPSATDDDVVARQLREAAMREPDAQLREKLWNEYRKYTGLPVPTGDAGQ